MSGISNYFRPGSRGRALPVIALLLVFVFQLWVTRARLAEQFDRDHDFTSYVTLGRGLVETHWLPTFIFPGKTFDGPVKQFWNFMPGLVLGHHEWIPVFMIALTATLICLLCYAIARLVAGRAAGLAALLLCGAMDPYVVRYAFRHAYSFDMMVVLGLCLGWLVMRWGRCVRSHARQPGWFPCLSLGIVAGLYFYTHPTGAAAILAAALFLAFTLGVRVFTWRVPVTALGFFLGSAPFWIYWFRYGGVLSSWRGYAGKYDEAVQPAFFFLSPDGYMRFLLSPGGGTWRAAAMALALAAGLVMLVAGARKAVRKVPVQPLLARLWRQGWELPEALYMIFLALCMGGVILGSSGMSQASGGWAYGIELWFWVMIAVACVLGLLVSRCRAVGVVVMLMACSLAYAQTAISLRECQSEREQDWDAVKVDADTLMAGGHDRILTTDHADNILFALGKEPPLVATTHAPWVLPLAEQVELAAAPAIMARLDEDVHGRGSWQSLQLSRGEVKHTFAPPPTGQVLPRGALDIRLTGDGAPGGVINDDAFSTSWTAPAKAASAQSLEIRLDRTRSICRLVLFSNREGADWRKYSSLRNITIEGMNDAGTWTVLVEGACDDGFHWDGPRLFYDVRERHRLDIRFQSAAVKAIRLRDCDGSSAQVRRLTELYVFESSGPASHAFDAAALVDFARAHDIKRVLSGRFVAARLTEEDCGIEVWRPAVLRGPMLKLERDGWPWFTGFEPVEPGVMIVAEKGFSGRIEALLAAQDSNITTRDFGTWVAYVVDREQATGEGLDLVWNGFCVGHLMRKQAAQGHRPPPADKVLLEEIAYGGVARLVAVEMSPQDVRAGEEVRVRYTWRIPDRWKHIYSRPTVFCHFRSGDTRIGDDHLLLGSTDRRLLRKVMPGELFSEERVIAIPATAPKGSYDLEIGLHFAGERVRCKTRKYPMRRNAARLPAFAVVE